MALALGVVVSAGYSASARPKYSAIVIDRNSGKTLYSRNADAQRYPASLTKMMTLYIVFDVKVTSFTSKSAKKLDCTGAQGSL